MTDRPDRRIRVLIADDHAVVREGLRSMLAASDIEVVAEACSGAEAVEFTSDLKPDVVLMDIRMPDVDGLNALAAIKRQCPRTSVIILSTYGNVQYLVRAVTHGAAAYFLKGISRDELLAAIRNVSAGESLLKPRQLNAVVERLLREDVSARSTRDRQAERLTRREREIVALVAQGLTNKQIAQALSISTATVKTHVETIIRKLGVSDRTQAAVWAVRAGVAGP
jgi:DNA-binding NarL/FixJ family response regulator